MKYFFLFSFLSITSVSFCDEPWPQANGPHGNFTPKVYQHSLIDDFKDARLVWQSEDRDLGYAKGSVSGYYSHLARWDGHPGSCSGPIIADGKIFVTSFRPSGTPWAKKAPGLDRIKKWKRPLTAPERRQLQRNLRILADDLLVAIDVKTGQTVWKAIEKERGLNRYMGKRQGFCVSPAFSDGKIFSMGTTGALYAYDSKSGDKLWEKNIGKAYQKALEHKEKCLNKEELAGGMGWDSSLIVAQKTLIVPLFDSSPDQTLRGVRLKDGETLWEIPKACSRHATPAIWTHHGKQYLLSATVSGELRLIDPPSGKVLWTVSNLGQNHFSLSPSQTHVFVNGGSQIQRRPGKDQKFGLLAAYKLSLTQPELTWKHPEQEQFLFSTWMDNCARRFMVPHQNQLYFYSSGPDKKRKWLHLLDQKTGKAIKSNLFTTPGPHFYPIEDRLLVIRDASHSKTEIAFFDPHSKDLSSKADFHLPSHQNTTAYEVYMEHPYYDGHLFLRTRDGRIACYDLRKN